MGFYEVVSLHEIQQILATIGVTPSKVLGQNFLFDQNLAASITRALGGGTAAVVEIGPGLGALTGLLEESRAGVLAIEWDRKLAGYLRDRFGDSDKVEVEVVDAAGYDTRCLHPRGIEYLLGNLPYKSSAPILFRFLQAASPIREAVVMLQQELAERIAARPGQDSYGSAAVVLQRRWHIELLRKVPPAVFYPRPRVDSALLKFQLRPSSDCEPCEAAEFERLVRLGFSQRRKQLGNLLPVGAADWRQLCAQLEIDHKCRAEDLDVLSWVRLVNLLSGFTGQLAQAPEHEIFDVVDENDEVVGTATRQAVHAEQLKHRSVHILVENSAGEVFLQKRSQWKDVCPGKWDSSAAGHLDAGETYRQAAAREVVEELGVEVPLERVGRLAASEQTGWEFVEVYSGIHEGPFRLPPAEIEAGEFFCRELLGEWLRMRPQDFAPGFIASYAVWLEAQQRNSS